MNQLVQIEHIALPDHAPVVAVPESNKADAHQAEINASALMGWCDSLSAQAKSDVSDGLLFAQLAADAQCNKFDSPRAWIDRTVEVLEILGWQVHQEASYGMKTLNASKNWRDLAIDSFERGYGGPARLVTRIVEEAAALEREADAVKLWNGHSTSGDRGLFLLGLAVADGSGDPIVSLMFTSFQMDLKAGGILDWDMTGQWADEFMVLRLDTDYYQLFRDQVQERLGTRVNTEVNEIAL